MIEDMIMIIDMITNKITDTDNSHFANVQIRNHLSAFRRQKADKCSSWSQKFFGCIFFGCFGFRRQNRLLGNGICQTQNQVSLKGFLSFSLFVVSKL